MGALSGILARQAIKPIPSVGEAPPWISISSGRRAT
jgi:hypothetical protein